MWRYAAQSVRGSHHDADGTPCQDASLVRVFGEGPQNVLLACAADGAGSARHSGVGANLACTSLIESASAHFAATGASLDFDSQLALRWCDSARQSICDEAELRGHALRDYACTLCVAIVSRNRSIFIQIGDGAIVVSRESIFGVVFWPQSGEYINTTNFLTSSEFRDQIQVCETANGFSDVAVFTDGIERLALRFDTFTPHPPFFKPLFGALRAATDVDALTRDLGRFLQSESVQNKTDDDKTLILASWLSADG